MPRLATCLLLVAAVALCALACSASVTDARKDSQHVSHSADRRLNEDRALAPRTHASHTRNGVRVTDSPYVSSTRSAAGSYFEVEWPSYWSNATFAEAVCNISLETDIVTSIEIEPNDDDVPILWVLPECIYPYLNSLTYFRARNVIIRGNASIAGGDPLLRLPTTIDSFEIRHPTVLQNPSKSYSGGKYPYAMDWTKLFNRFPLLDDMEISGAQLTGTLPSSLPAALSSFEVSKNSLSGGIPATLLSNMSIDTSGVTLDLGENDLTGAIPTGLFSFLNATSHVDTLQVWLNDNKLTGSVPVALINRTAPAMTYFTLNLANNQLSGTVPANFLSFKFTALDTLSITLSGNQLTGNLPASLFAPLVGLSSLNSLRFYSASNQLSGSIPDLWTNIALSNTIYRVVLDLSGNRLDGSVPSYIAPSAFTVQTFTFNLASNKLTGTVSSSLLSARYRPNEYNLDLSNNQLSGNLPSTLSMNGMSTVSLSLASNSFTGTLPSTFLTDTGSLYALRLNLANNDFEGSVPSNFISGFTSRSNQYTLSATINLANCGLSGSLPASLRGNLWYTTIDVSNNEFEGSIPPEFFSDNGAVSSQTTLNAAHNKLSGQLALTQHSAYVYLNVSYNELAELSIDDATMGYITVLDVSHNTNLTGTIPVALFDTDATLSVLKASRTALSGTFPDLSGQVIEIDGLDLSFTNIDFCAGGNRTRWSALSLVECNLRNTNASTSCPDGYPTLCTDERVTSPKAPTAFAPSQLTGLLASLLAVLVIAILVL